MLVENRLDLQITRLKNLPELPAASVRILDAVSNPEIAIDELANIISLSPVLVARLLGLANSAYFGCNNEIKDLKTAVIRVLGLNLVKSLTLGVLLNLALDTSQCPHFKSEKVWMNALVTAALAQKFSLILRDESMIPSTCFTAGLFLSIGLIAAVHLFPKETDQVFKQVELNSSSVADEMVLLLGYDHFYIGGVLLKHWRLPGIYQTVLKEFKNPDYTGEERKFIEFLALSNKVAKNILMEQEDETAQGLLQLEKFGLSSALSQPIVSEVKQNKENIYLAALTISGK